MKKIRNTQICASATLACLFLSLPARATITNILCNGADYTSQQTTNLNNSIASTTDAIGFAGGTPSWTAILMFPLPAMPVGKVVGNQTTLSVTLNSVGASTTFNADIWGVANFRTDLPTGTPAASFYYYLVNDAGPGANPTVTDAKLVNNFMTPALIGSAGGTIVTTTPGATNTIQNYVQGFYTANPGYTASPQAYAWFRINADGPSGSTANRYVINAGDSGVNSTLRPKLNLDIADPPTKIPLVWNGNVSPDWDINTTANWKSNSVSGFVYVDNSDVVFDDNLAANPTVQLNTTVAPSAVSVNNSATSYLVTGSGKITGTTGFTKLGTNTFILDTDNDYSGATTLGNGTLQVGNNDTHGSLGSGNVSVTGVSTLAFNRTDAITINNVTNAGNLPNLVVNSGSVTLGGTADNVGAGATVNGGTLVLGKPSSGTVHALGTSSTIKAGGTLQLGGSGNDQIFRNAYVTNNGTFDLAGYNEGFNGITGNGVVTNSSATNSILTVGEGDGGGSASFSGVIKDGASATVGVTKSGAGTQTLTGVSTYTGLTTISAGKLLVTTATQATGNYTNADNATFGVIVGSPDAGLTVNALTVGNSKLEFQSVNSVTTSVLTVTSLVLNGTATINVTGGNFEVGQTYPLITYSSISGSGGYTLGSLPPGVFGTLSTTSSTIVLYITSTALTWNGDLSGVWDIDNTPNWKAGAITGLPYPDGEIVTLDDTLGGTPTIDLQAVVSPLALTVSNNTTAYSISGSGYISGPLVFTKTGTNVLILDTDNDYFGGTVLAGGTLQVGNNDTHGLIGSGAFTNLVAGSILAFNRTDAITINNTITRTTVDNSASLLIKSGSVTIAGAGDNSGAGATVNSGATLILAKDSTANVHALSSANIVVNSGGLLQLAGFGNDQIYQSSGMTDNGVFDLAGHTESFDRLSGTGVVSNSSGSTVTLQLGELNGSSTFAGTIVNGSGTTALTKIGTGTLALTGASTYNGDTLVNVGKLVAATSSTGAGNYSTANGATLGVSVASANGSLNVNALTLGASAANALEFQALNSTSTAAVTAATLNVNGAVTVNVASGAFAANQSYPLIAYANRSGSGSFVLGTLPSGVQATLSANASPITLNVTSVVNRTPTNIISSYANGVLNLQWPADHIGWLLQSNSVSLLSTNSWVGVAGSTNTNSVNITVNVNMPQVYFRLVD